MRTQSPAHAKQSAQQKSPQSHASGHQVAAAHVVDNRPEAVAQCRMQALAETSPRTAQLKAQMEMIDNSPRLMQQKGFGDSAVQRQEYVRAPNDTGLPDGLKAGVETLSGMSMDHVKVHYNSAQPAQLNALAYAQGSDIHVAPGQEQHLPHEAWHVVQQAQGRVKPTTQLNGDVPVNDNEALEAEADVMGAKAVQLRVQDGLESKSAASGTSLKSSPVQPLASNQPIAQLTTKITHKLGTVPFGGQNYMVGKKMTATLDPEDVVTGSATTSDNYDWMKGIRAYYSAAGVIRGHLLNHDLGGYGVPENLYPISSMANSQHSDRVEQKVKGELSQSASNTKKEISYQVVVNEMGPSETPYEKAEFDCTWIDEDGNKFNEVISSQLNIDFGWGGKSQSALNSPSKWRHGARRGDLDMSAKIRAGKIEIDGSTLDNGLRTRTTEAKGIDDTQDWNEAVTMLSNELDELATVSDPNAPPQILRDGIEYLKWIQGEITKATATNQLAQLTGNESRRFMGNLIAIRKGRIYEQDGVDTESNIASYSEDVEMD